MARLAEQEPLDEAQVTAQWMAENARQLLFHEIWRRLPARVALIDGRLNAAAAAALMDFVASGDFADSTSYPELVAQFLGQWHGH